MYARMRDATMSVVREGVAILREDGPGEFVRAVSRYLRWQFVARRSAIRARRAVARGYVELSVAGASAEFVAENRVSIERTLRRFAIEYDRIERLLTELNDDDVFYDVGANTGLYTCLAADICSHVAAFEPYPPNVSELQQNVARNDGNVSVHELALSNTDGSVGFAVPETASPGYGKASLADDTAQLEVPTIRGDSLVADDVAPPPNVVKIDVEGAEPLVVEGLEKTLSRQQCRLVHCEVHRPDSSRDSIRDHGTTESEFLDRFTEMGFDTTIIADNGSEFVVEARRRHS